MLNAIGAPLVLRDLGEDDRALIEKFINNAILRGLLEVLERMLYYERAGLVASQSRPLALERSVDTKVSH